MAVTNKALLAADGRNRALRTFLQGLGTDVLAAVILLLLPVFTSASGWQDFDWAVMGFMLAKTVTITAFSYIMRVYLDKSRVPTPLPPEPQVEPADPVNADGEDYPAEHGGGVA